MRSREEVVKIRAEIERLEQARKRCTDSGIQEQIDVWIEEQKKKLIGGNNREWKRCRSRIFPERESPICTAWKYCRQVLVGKYLVRQNAG